MRAQAAAIDPREAGGGPLDTGRLDTVREGVTLFAASGWRHSAIAPVDGTFPGCNGSLVVAEIQNGVSARARASVGVADEG